jgi:peptidyl-prolyl cis-trans isomerase B (cyclophilin B)
MTINPTVLLKTSMGDVTISLNAEKAPNTVKNFVDYVKAGFYDGTIFHRVISNFMVQGGGFTPDMTQKPVREPIKNEANNGLNNDQYTIAMARTSDPHSATAQFFINVTNNDFLNFTKETTQGWGYAVFGQVTAGFDVVDAMKGVKTATKGFHQDVPVEPLTILSATLVTAAE